MRATGRVRGLRGTCSAAGVAPARGPERGEFCGLAPGAGVRAGGGALRRSMSTRTPATRCSVCSMSWPQQRRIAALHAVHRIGA